MCNMAMKAQGLTYVSTDPAMCNLYLDGHENAADIIATMASEQTGMTPGWAWHEHAVTDFCVVRMALLSLCEPTEECRGTDEE